MIGMLSGISSMGVRPNMSSETKFATRLAARVETQKSVKMMIDFPTTKRRPAIGALKAVAKPAAAPHWQSGSVPLPDWI